jgi:endoglucanase
MAYDITKDNKYLNAVSSSLDYIFGRNPMENSYVTGYGENHTKYPHHRYWAFQLDPNYPIAPSGVLSGGPNSAMQDPYIQGMGYKIGEVPPQKCYLDNIESYSTNECTINWNAPLTWIAAFMNEYVSENSEETVYELGDINMSGNIDNIDLVDLCQVLIKEKTLNQSQKSYADLNNDSQVDIADAIILKQKLLGS